MRFDDSISSNGSSLLAVMAVGDRRRCATVAWLIAPDACEIGFRPIWMVMSVLLFVVPGVIGIMRMRKDERAARVKDPKQSLKNDDG